MNKSEMAKVERYLRQTFANHAIRVVSRRRRRIPPRFTSVRNSSACCSFDDEDGDRSFNFQMAILDTDLED